MTHKERFLATIERRPVDRPASWLGLPKPQAVPGLLDHFGVSGLDGLREAIDDDVYPIDFPYHSPTADAIWLAFDFAKKGSGAPEEWTLNSPGFFEDSNDLALVDKFPWPDPAKYIDREECRRRVFAAPSDRAIMGSFWSCHFQDALAAFGMENAMMQMVQAPEMVHAVSERIVDFYLKANAIFFEATKGKLDAVLIGNDIGGQDCLMVSPRQLREFVLPGARLLIEQAHRYGAKVIYHSCGSIYDFIPDLIAAGVDAIHPIQALAKRMDARGLKAAFGERTSFVGGVAELRAIFPTGLVISPSHEAILPDVPPANVAALFQAINTG
jgi:uroporphyrinogen decarboxylase